MTCSDPSICRLLAVTFVVTLPVTVGCVEHVIPSVRLEAGDDDPTTPDAVIPAELQLFDARAQRVDLLGAINEVVDFQLALAGRGALDVHVDPFTSAAGDTIAGNVTLYRVHEVDVNRIPGWHHARFAPSRRVSRIGDVLVPANAPIGGLPARPEGCKLHVWVDVRIPKGTRPGDYKARMHVLSGGIEAQSVEVALRVLPFVLPDAAGPPALVDVDHQTLFLHHVRFEGKPLAPERILPDHPAAPLLDETLADTMRLLRSHRLVPQLPWLRPVLKVEADRSIVVDWTDYDRAVARFVSGDAYSDRLPSPWWQIPFDETFPRPPVYGAMNSPTFTRTVDAYLANAAEHFDAMGWLPRAFVHLPGRRIGDVASHETAEHFGYILRHADERLRVMSTLCPQDLGAFGWDDYRPPNLDRYVDVWDPPAQFLDRSAIDARFGSQAWLHVDHPPFSGSLVIQAPLADARVIPWQAHQSRASAIDLGLVNNWPGIDDATPQDCIDHDPTVLLYPGAVFGLAQPVPSVRLKRLRRGLQDLAYLTLLKARGKEHIAATIADSLAPFCGSDCYGAHLADGRPGGWVTDWQMWRMARRIMADELQTTVDSQNATGAETAPTTVRWQRFMNALRRVRLRVMGVRVITGSTAASGASQVECTIEIQNQKRVPVSGKMGFGDLPVGWLATPPSVRVGLIAPSASRRVALRADFASMSWNEAGATYLPVVFEENGGERHAIRARLCHLTPQRVAHAPVIDGDLADWPMGVGNYASDFILLVGEPADATAQRLNRPTRDTTCFVAADGASLFFGIRCEFDPAATNAEARLEDLVPTGRELFEILLDPANAGTRLPDDIYRIAVSLRGVVTERGVPTDPPIGVNQVWPAAVRYALRVDDTHWTAEVSLPLSALPDSTRRVSTWGINFARFDAPAQEYSNWAGAVGNVYDPLSLGNMTVP